MSYKCPAIWAIGHNGWVVGEGPTIKRGFTGDCNQLFNVSVCLIQVEGQISRKGVAILTCRCAARQ